MDDILSRHKLYGRGRLTAETQEAIFNGVANRILLQGPSGIGKSAFLADLHASVRQLRPDIVCIYHEVESSAHTLQYVLSRLTAEMLEQTAIPGASLVSLRKALSQCSASSGLSIITSLLIDCASTLAPQTKKTVEGLAAVLEHGMSTSARAVAERIVKEGGTDLLAGFINIISAISGQGIHGCVIIDRLEAGSEPVVDAAGALSTGLPESWAVILAVNDELPEGLKVIDRIWSPLARRGGKQVILPRLDISALEAWRTAVAGDCPDIEVLRKVLSNCDGRPLFLRDWVLGFDTEAASRRVSEQLAPYYGKRIKSLSQYARRLLDSLSVLPSRSPFSFGFCARILHGTDQYSVQQSVSELEAEGFIQRDYTQSEAYIIVNELVQRYVVEGLPRSMREEASVRLLDAIGSETSSDNPYEAYTRLVLLDISGEHAAALDVALSTAERLAEVGAHLSSLDAYERCLRLAVHAGNLDKECRATIGIAQVKLDTGYYAAALDKLAAIDPSSLAYPLKAQVCLIRGHTLLRLNRYADAVDALKEAYGLYEELCDDVGQARVWKDMVTIRRDKGEYQKAISESKSLVQFAESKQLPGLVRAECYRALARSLAFESQFTDALEAAGTALQIAEHLSSLRDIGNAHLALGEAYRHGHQYDEAVTHYSCALGIAAKILNRDSALWSALGLADALLLAGRLEDARSTLNDMGDVLSSAQDRYPLEYLHWRLSLATLDYLDDPATGADFLKAADAYGTLRISWPRRYAEELIRRRKVSMPKQM